MGPYHSIPALIQVVPKANLLRRQLLQAMAASFAMMALGPVGCGQRPPRFSGTFIQLLNLHFTWDEQAWRRLFDALARLGVGEVVVQWSAYGNISFADRRPPQRYSPLEHLLHQADRLGMGVWQGLVYDAAWWDPKQRVPSSASDLLKRLLAKSLHACRTVTPMYTTSPVFLGWYITAEVDDLSWPPEAREPLFLFLKSLSDELKRVIPSAGVAVSGFTDSSSTPDQVRHFWAELFEHAPSIGHLFFQDGVGVEKLDVDAIGLYLGAAAAAARQHGRKFYPIVETFAQTAGEPFTNGAFAAEPAGLDRIVAQLTEAGRLSENILAFSLPEYMTPAGGPAAAQLYAEYLRYLQR